MGAKEIWNELKKKKRNKLVFILESFYVSPKKEVEIAQELAVFKTNEYYNKHFFTLQKHKKLLWQLLCLAGNTKKIQYS